jgi:hypothetical protein
MDALRWVQVVHQEDGHTSSLLIESPTTLRVVGVLPHNARLGMDRANRAALRAWLDEADAIQAAEGST